MKMLRKTILPLPTMPLPASLVPVSSEDPGNEVDFLPSLPLMLHLTGKRNEPMI